MHIYIFIIYFSQQPYQLFYIRFYLFYGFPLPFPRPKIIKGLVLVYLAEMLLLPHTFVAFLVSPIIKSNDDITLL